MSASASGLSRRRGRAGSGSGIRAGNEDGDSPTTNNASSNVNSNNTATSPVASYGLAANGEQSSSKHKIAYDPRDIEERSEELEMPKLTLMEEILLLGLKDKQGYLSFWNDNISYTLRGCIVLELALRHRIAVVKDPNRRRFPLADRYIEVVDERMTGEVLLDEALKMMKVSEKMSIGSWVDLMSGETWNVMKIGYQLKQVRERLAKGLVDKGVLRTEKKNFLLFDMATHPVADPTFKDEILRRVLNLLASKTSTIQPYAATLYNNQSVRYKVIRVVCMICCAFAANVLENALVHLNYDQRESAFSKCEELLQEFSQWPIGGVPQGGPGSSIGTGSGGGSAGGKNAVIVGQRNVSGNSDATASANLAEICKLARAEASSGQELHLEVVAGVISILSRMDSLL